MGIMRYKSLRSMVNGAVAPVPFDICGDDTIEVELNCDHADSGMPHYPVKLTLLPPTVRRRVWFGSSFLG